MRIAGWCALCGAMLLALADTIMPIGFVDGRVTGWGRLYNEDAMTGRIRPDGSVPK